MRLFGVADVAQVMWLKRIHPGLIDGGPVDTFGIGTYREDAAPIMEAKQVGSAWQ